MIVPYPSASPRPLEAGGSVLTPPSWFPYNRPVAVAVRSRDGTVLSIVDTADGTGERLPPLPTDSRSHPFRRRESALPMRPVSSDGTCSKSPFLRAKSGG